MQPNPMTQPKTALRIALFRHAGDNTVLVLRESCEKFMDGIRISEYVDVEFPHLVSTDAIDQQAKEIDQRIRSREREIDQLRKQKTAVLSQAFASEPA
jgi:hypothetical protein